MSHRTLLSAVICLMLLVPDPSQAGRNASGRAWLTWDEAGAVTDLRTVPSTTFPLFVHLGNAPDVRALAIHLRWFPLDPLRECYSILPASATATCGWASAIPPGSDFEGDSSYTWSILFPPLDPGRACVQYLVSALSCAGAVPTADFVLASVLVKDSRGAVDTLLVVGEASIQGGSAPALESVDPREIPAGRQAVIAIRGREFEPGTHVELRGPDLRITASEVLVVGPTALTATVKAPDSPGSLLDVLVRLADGRSARLPAAIRIVSSSSAVGASPSLSRPTNDSAAFRKFDLYADRVTRWNVHDHIDFVALGIYPSSLDSDALLVARSSADTMGLFKSKPSDGIRFNCGCQGFPSYVGYAVTPPQYATSIGVLNMAVGVFNGTGEFNDYDIPALRLVWTFADGDSASQIVRVGKHVRNWRSGSIECNGTQPFYVTPPESLAAVLYTGPLPPAYGAGDAYYDAVELPLAPGNRSRKLASLRIDAVDHQNYCGGLNVTSEHSLYGFSIWPNFRVVNPQGQGIGHQTQNTGRPYGGYIFNGDTVGTRRTMNANACQISSISMLHNYHATPCTPNELNRYLRQYRAFDREDIAFVRWVSVTGDTIGFKGPARTSKDWEVGHTFLIEHGPYNPIATVRIDWKPGAGGGLATGHVIAAHQPGSIAVGDTGFTYRWPDIKRAGFGFANQQRKIVTVTDAAKVESLLVRNHPVYLCTHNRKGDGWHFVVADGWSPAFVSDTSALGTYNVKDPGYNRQRLLELPFKNEFRYARYFTPVAEGIADDGPGDDRDLTLLISEVVDVTITDPAGRRVFLDEAGVYSSEIPDAFALRGWTDDDEADQSDPENAGLDVFELPEALEGRYLVRVVGRTDPDLAISVTSSDNTGVRSTAGAFDSTASGTGNLYAVDYDASSGSLGIQLLGVAAVEDGLTVKPSLRVLGNPAAGSVSFAVDLQGLGHARLEIYDLVGRRVDSVPLQGTGPQVVSWDGRRTGRVAGMYFARLRSGSGDRTARFALTR